MREAKWIRLLTGLFLLSACINLALIYLWAQDWAARQIRAAQASAAQVSSAQVRALNTGSDPVTAAPAPGTPIHSTSASPTGTSASPTGAPTRPAGGIPHAGPAERAAAPTLTPTGTPVQIQLPAILQLLIQPSPTPTHTPPPVQPSYPGPHELNGLPVEQIVVLSDAAVLHMRQIYQDGQSRGARAGAFAKIGDSTIEHPYFLARFDEGPYQLGEYAYLQEVIEAYRGSFGRRSPAVRVGLHSWTVMDPMWADKSVCLGAESPAACELRLQQPSLVFIRLGANDDIAQPAFYKNMEALLNFSIEQGVIPILSTKPGYSGSSANNAAIRELAEAYDVPLWDFERAAQTLPGGGLDGDDTHLTTFYAHDYSLPEALRRGHGLQNLTALIMLDRIWRCLQ